MSKPEGWRARDGGVQLPEGSVRERETKRTAGMGVIVGVEFVYIKRKGARRGTRQRALVEAEHITKDARQLQELG